MDREDTQTKALAGILVRLDERIGQLTQEVSGVRSDVAYLRARDEEHRRNIERFWDKDWEPHRQLVDAINERMVMLEKNASAASVLVERGREIEAAVESLQLFRSRVLGIVAAASAAVGFAVIAVEVAFRVWEGSR